MSNTFEEDVNGVVIGDMAPEYRGRLFYDGRAQGGVYGASSEAKLVALMRTHKHRLISECGNAAYLIYPDDSKWELRIYSEATP